MAILSNQNSKDLLPASAFLCFLVSKHPYKSCNGLWGKRCKFSHRTNSRQNGDFKPDSITKALYTAVWLKDRSVLNSVIFKPMYFFSSKIGLNSGVFHCAFYIFFSFSLIWWDLGSYSFLLFYGVSHSRCNPWLPLHQGLQQCKHVTVKKNTCPVKQ